MKSEGQHKLFCGRNFYPSGGYEDFKGNFTSCKEAIQFIENEYKDGEDVWAHIVQNDKIIMRGINDDRVYPIIWKWQECDL